MARRAAHNFAAHVSQIGTAPDRGYAFMPGIMRDLRGQSKATPRKRQHCYEMHIGLTNEQNLNPQQLHAGLKEARDILRGQSKQRDMFVAPDSISILPHGAVIVDMINGDTPSLSVMLKRNCLSTDRQARKELAAQWEDVQAAVMEKLEIRQLRSRCFPRLMRDNGQGYMRTA